MRRVPHSAWTRREWLRLGGLGAFGLSLSGLLRAADRDVHRPRSSRSTARSLRLSSVSGWMRQGFLQDGTPPLWIGAHDWCDGVMTMHPSPD